MENGKVQTTGFGYEKEGVKLSFTLTNNEEKKIFLELLEKAKTDVANSIQ